MLHKILKLFGFDVVGATNAVKQEFGLRLEEAGEAVKRTAVETSVIGALLAMGVFTTVMAVGVGLIAFYRWITELVGPYAGLGAVAAVLICVAATLFLVARAKSESAQLRTERDTRDTKAVDAESAAASKLPPETEPGRIAPFFGPAANMGSTAVPASADDFTESLAFFLSEVLGNRTAAELVRSRRPAADEAVERIADVIQHGERAHLIIVLAGAVIGGWFLARRS